MFLFAAAMLKFYSTPILLQAFKILVVLKVLFLVCIEFYA